MSKMSKTQNPLFPKMSFFIHSQKTVIFTQKLCLLAFFKIYLSKKHPKSHKIHNFTTFKKFLKMDLKKNVFPILFWRNEKWTFLKCPKSKSQTRIGNTKTFYQYFTY